jgi:hypothetical protein
MSALKDLVDFEIRVSGQRFGEDGGQENENYANMVLLAAAELQRLEADRAECLSALIEGRQFIAGLAFANNAPKSSWAGEIGDKFATLIARLEAKP